MDLAHGCSCKRHQLKSCVEVQRIAAQLLANHGLNLLRIQPRRGLIEQLGQGLAGFFRKRVLVHQTDELPHLCRRAFEVAQHVHQSLCGGAQQVADIGLLAGQFLFGPCSKHIRCGPSGHTRQFGHPRQPTTIYTLCHEEFLTRLRTQAFGMAAGRRPLAGSSQLRPTVVQTPAK